MLFGWNKNNILKFSIDHNKVLEDLTDFPVLLNLTDESGLNNFDCSDVFDELYEQNIHDDFTGNNGDNPNTDLWINNVVYDSSRTQHPSQINGNRLQQYVPHNTSDENECAIKSTFLLSGDFDVQIDYDCDGNVPDYLAVCTLVIRDIDNTRIGLLRRENGKTRYNTSTTSTTTNSSYAYRTAKWRITRVGTTITQYIWKSSTNSWVYLKAYDAQSAKNAYIFLRTDNWGGGYTEWTCYFDNFKVNSGTIIWATNTLPTRKKIAVVYPPIQKHWVDAVNDNFNGDDNDPPNDKLWDVNVDLYGDEREKVEPYIYNNRLKFVLESQPDDRGNITSKYWLKGDFCVEATFDLSGNVDCNFVALYFWKDIDNRGDFAIKDTDNVLQAWSNVNGTGSSTDISITLLDTITLRLERIGSNIYYYYRNGATSELTYATHKTCTTDDVLITLRADAPNTTTNTSIINILDYKLIYGTIDWKNNTPVKELKEYPHGSTTQLYTEIERWDQTNKSAQLWVKVPKILSDQPTDIYMYYDKEQDDNTTYIGDTGDTPAQNVWDDNYLAIYHLSQDPSVTIIDSTKNNYNGTPYSMSTNNLVGGCVGKCLYFDGSADYININNLLNENRYKLTVDISFKTNAVGSEYNSILYSIHDSDDTNRLRIANNTKLRIHDLGGSSTYEDGITTINNNIWHQLSITLNTGSKAHWYVDGTIDGDMTQSVYFKKNGKMSIAQEYDPTNVAGDFFEGYIGEVRISNIDRTYEWIFTTHSTFCDNICYVNKADIYYYTGNIYQKGLPVQRDVFLYDRVSGELMDKCISTVSGTYYLTTTVSGEHNVVCHADENYQDVILGRILPDELS